MASDRQRNSSSKQDHLGRWRQLLVSLGLGPLGVPLEDSEPHRQVLSLPCHRQEDLLACPSSKVHLEDKACRVILVGSRQHLVDSRQRLVDSRQRLVDSRVDLVALQTHLDQMVALAHPSSR